MSLRPHVFMDETQYRSAATVHYAFHIAAIPPAASSYGYSDDYRTAAAAAAAASYTDDDDDHYPTSDWYAGDAAWQQRIRQIYLEQSGARWYTDRMIQRAHLKAAIANGAIMWHPSTPLLYYVQPMLAPTASCPCPCPCPPGWTHPTHVHHLLQMSNTDLRRIMMAYNLLPARP